MEKEEEGIKSVANGTGASGAIAAVALQSAGLEQAERIEKVRVAFMEESAVIEKHLGTIAVVATLLPMLGLLGTVMGMIAAFNAIAAHGTGNPRIVADGIAEALITTEAGLLSSIPLIYLHRIVTNRSEQLLRRLDEFTTHLLHLRTGA